MLLTVTTTAEPARDLGYLLHKHPDRVQRIDVTHGSATVFFPAASDTSCTAALLLEVDPVGLVRGRQNDAFSLGQYVNDRPYAASSMLAVALRKAFATAMKGRCEARPELAVTALPLRIEVPVLPSTGGGELAQRLFAPLGWTVTAEPIALDEEFPAWGVSRYVRLTLTGELRLSDALTHLYVLLPVLDDAKHYWVAEDEVEKLLTAGGEWLAAHPEQGLIVRRYLRKRGHLVRATLARLAEADDLDPDAEDPDTTAEAEPQAERQEPLRVLRRKAVLHALRDAGAARVLDLGCGDGALLGDLMEERSFTEIVGVDVSVRALQYAQRRLAKAPDRVRERVRLLQGALTYTDDRLAGFDAAVLMEVIEHVDPPRLGALERAVFAAAHPRTVLVTTPNAEYNARYDWLPAGRFRHPDHRFEWTRAEFAAWANSAAAAHGYGVRFVPVGPEDDELGAPTQLAVFSR